MEGIRNENREIENMCNIGFQAIVSNARAGQSKECHKYIYIYIYLLVNITTD